MTPAQRRLARHALGLPNQYRRSYRNRYIGPATHPEWSAMVAAGEAQIDEERAGWFSENVCFWLTLKGALEALNAGEVLDREDFPTAPSQRRRRTTELSAGST